MKLTVQWCYSGIISLMIEAKCPKCRKKFFGWALAEPKPHTCDDCGATLTITRDTYGFKGYSLFTAQRYQVNPHIDDVPSRIMEKGTSTEHDLSHLEFWVLLFIGSLLGQTTNFQVGVIFTHQSYGLIHEWSIFTCWNLSLVLLWGFVNSDWSSAESPRF